MLLAPPAPQRRLYERAIKVAVRIDCVKRDGSDQRTGTGFVLSKDGFILTAYHVVLRHPTIYVRRLRLDDDAWTIHPFGKYAADMVFHDSKADVALLKLRRPPRTLAVARLAAPGTTDLIRPGDAIYRVGCDDYELSSGFVYDTTQTCTTGIPCISVSMLADVGMSGGPAFNKDGEVIGATLEANLGQKDPCRAHILSIDEIRRRVFSRKWFRAAFPGVTQL